MKNEFPRQRCLGYIEAILFYLRFVGFFSNFRGNAASATLKLFLGAHTGGQRGDFRGNAASATLKLSRELRPRRFPLGFPRQRCLGYIEAVRSSPTNSINHAFPRQRCLGYIEACRKARRRSNSTWPFPRQRCLGYIEAPRERAFRHRTRRFPRQRCLGYIEARCRVRPENSSRPDFRGNAASATLKPGTPGTPRARLAYFRGNAASATLKPDLPQAH